MASGTYDSIEGVESQVPSLSTLAKRACIRNIRGRDVRVMSGSD